MCSLGVDDREVDVLLARRFKELVVEVKLEPVALAQAVVALGAGSVDLDALEADVLLRQRGGQQGNGLEQKAVEPLVSVIFMDGELSHGAASFRAQKHFEVILRYPTVKCKEIRSKKLKKSSKNV